MRERDVTIHPHKRRSGAFRNAMDAGLGIVVLKLLVGLVILLSLTGGLSSVLLAFKGLLAW